MDWKSWLADVTRGYADVICFILRFASLRLMHRNGCHQLGHAQNI